MNKEKRIRLNTEMRNKLALQFRQHFENESTQEKEKFLQTREKLLKTEAVAFNLMKKIVNRQYPKKDVEMATHLSNAHKNVDIYRTDCCFNLDFVENVEERRYNSHTQQNETIKVEKEQSQHFDFKLGNSGTNQHKDNMKFAYAMYREEMKQNGLNPDIIVEHENKADSPYYRKITHANDEFLGWDRPTNSQFKHNYKDEYEEKYAIEVIGSSYCGSRDIKSSLAEVYVLRNWQSERQQVFQTHETWIKTVLEQIQIIKQSLNSYKFFDEAVELAKTVGLNLKLVENVKKENYSLAIFNPKNVAQMLKSLKNKNVSRQDKIKARLLYEKQQQVSR